MRKALLILAMPIVLLMVGCAEEDASRDPQVNGSAMVKGMPIDFGTDDAGDTTRISPYLTRAAVNTLDLTLLQSKGFGVFATHTGLHTYANSSISSNFMYNQQVTYNTDHWEYSPLKYWPNGEDGSDVNDYVSFFAYAPYSETASACITDFPLPIEMGDPWLIYRLADDVASQVDLLYATPVLDQTKPASTNTKVNFKFKHALACVGDKVTTSISEALGDLLKAEVASKASLTQIDVILRKVSIVYTLTSKGKLSLASSTALWKPVMSGEFTTKRTVTVFDGSASPFTLATITDAVAANEHSVSDKGVFYIPLQVGNEPQQATCTIDYTIRRTISGTPTPTDFNGSTTKTVNLREAGGEIAGAHLNLELQLSDQISVKGKSLASFTILPIAPQTYTGSGIEPDIIVTNGSSFLIKDTDYSITYSDNIATGVATVTIHGKGEYDSDSSISSTFIINPRHISNVSVNAIAGSTYDGTAKTPSVTVKDGSTTLVLNTDYTVAYFDNVNAGTAKVIITGMGNYTGSRIETFTIGKITPNLSITPTSLSWNADDSSDKTIYVIRDGDGAITAEITSGSGISVNTVGTTIVVSRTDMNPGEATITVSVAEGTNHSAASTTCSVSLNSTLALLKTWVVGLSSYDDHYCGYYVDLSGNISPTNNNAIGRIIDYYTDKDIDTGVPGSRIFVMALTDASSGCQWKINTDPETTDDYSAADYTAAGLHGYASTEAKKDVKDGDIYVYPAAHAAANYSIGRPTGASTWFLPSYAQLQDMLGVDQGVNIENNTYYWASTNNSTKDQAVVISYQSNACSFSSHNFTESNKVRACFVY